MTALRFPQDACIDKETQSRQSRAIHCLLQKTGDMQCSVLITGDFNFPHINWETATTPAPEDSPEHKLLDNLADSFTEHTMDPPESEGTINPVLSI